MTTNKGHANLIKHDLGADGLTMKQRLFVAEIVVDWNMTAAAKRAGYSPTSAYDIARDMMKLPKIVDAVAASMAKRVEKAGINAQWVLTKLVDVEGKAATIEGLGALDRRLKALELIGRHVDVDAFRGSASFRPIGEGPTRNWDLTRLDEAELNEFERLLAKIDTSLDSDADGRSGGTERPNVPAGPGTDDDEPGRDPGKL